MCGILGLYPFKFNQQIDQKVKTFIQRWLFVETLVNMESRGKDATGVSVLWKDSKTAVVKQPVTSSFFTINDGNVKDEYKDPKDERATFGWIMKKWSERLQVADVAQVLGHVRAKTKGSEYDPHNNHPIIISDTIKDKENPHIGENTIVGVHNGSVRNDDELTKKHGFKRIAEVDSEIIFQLINKYKDDLNLDTLTNIFDEISGLFAVLSYNTSKPNMVYGLRQDRPLEIGYIPQIGSIIAVSERVFVDNALTTLDRWRIREDSDNAFPYVSVEWMKTMDEGVFTMDLDTEVNSDTKVETLVNMKKVVKKVVTNTTAYNTTNTNKAAAPVAPIAPLPPVKAADKRSATIHDLTNYDKEETKDEILEKALPLTEEGSSLEIEVEVITETTAEVDEDDRDETGFSYAERASFGSDFFSSQILVGERGDSKMFLNLPSEEQKDILAKYGIKINNEEQLKAVTNILYEIVFPEGYAFGMTDGYNARDDENDDAKKEELQKKLSKFKSIAKELKKKLDAFTDSTSKKAAKTV
jgi:hypothetical protein